MAPVHSKKLAAIVAAVLQHVSEAEGPVPAVSAAAFSRTAEVSAVSPSAPAFWGVAGRQDAMLNRTLWQRRLSRSW